jgi:hypothetical protein
MTKATISPSVHKGAQKAKQGIVIGYGPGAAAGGDPIIYWPQLDEPRRPAIIARTVTEQGKVVQKRRL